MITQSILEKEVEKMSLQDWFDMFQGKNEAGQLDEMEQLLLSAGFKSETCEAQNGAKTIYFTKEGVKYIFALSVRKDKKYLPIIMDAEFAKKHYMKDGKFDKIIRLNGHSNKNSELTPVMDYNGNRNVKVHRVYMKELGYDIEDKEVDHINHCQGLIVEFLLRICTDYQNQLNRIGIKTKIVSDFLYDEAQDFRCSFWIPFLHLILDVISFDDMTKLRGMELKAQSN